MAPAPETLIALLRHGETQGGAYFRGSTDDPLTPLGWGQMRAAASGKPWTRIVSSPLRRCAEFAGELAARLAIPLELDERLREMHFGVWEGRSAAELMESEGDALTRFWRDPATFSPPGAESLQAFQSRVLDAWNDLRKSMGKPTSTSLGGGLLPPSSPFDEEGNAQRMLLVCHGGTIRTILCDVLRHPPERLLELELELGHGALRWVRLGNDGTSSLLDEVAT